MAESEDVNALKRRGRRRLVGAIALVLAAVIVLPMVFDSEPKGSAPPVSVRIPGEEESGFAPKVAQKAPEKALEKVVEKEPEKAAEQSATKAPEPPVEKPEPKIEVKVTKAVPAPSAPAVAAEQFMVPAGAYADPAAVIAKLKSARIPYYTEPIATKDGTVTRVRAGPFASREAADKVMKQLKGLGLKPGNVAAKS